VVLLACGFIMFRLYARSWGCGLNGDFLVGTWLVQPALNTVSLKGNAVRLEPKVMDVLVRLASRCGEPVSKQELLNTVWADAFVSEDVLARSISELRRAFDDNPRQPRFIETIPKRGYRLVAAVEPVGGKAPDATLTVQSHGKGKWFSASAAVVVLLIVGVVMFRGNSSNWPAKLTTSAFPVRVEAHTQDSVDVGKDRLSDPAPNVVKKKTLKVLHRDPLSIESPVTVVTVLNNTNVSQSEGTVTSQSTTERVPPRNEALFQNISPDMVRTRVKHAVLPTYPESAVQAHITGTVEIGIAVSPKGDVSSARVLIGHPLLITPALDAIRQWTFEPNRVGGELTWSRMRAMVRFLPDGTTAVAFAPPLLADNFGDLGSQRDELRDAAILPVVPEAR
jgi:TonB family protein